MTSNTRWNAISYIDTAIYYRKQNIFSLAGFAGESFRNISQVEKRFLTFDATKEDDFIVDMSSR